MLSDADKKEVAELYAAGFSLAELGKHLHVHPCVVRRACVDAGDVIRKRHGVRRLRLDDHAFDLMGEEPEYWIGFLMADGYVRGRRLTLRLQARDGAHVEAFRRFLRSGSRLTYIPATSRRQAVVGLTVTSEHIVDVLRGYGVTERKSLTAEALGGIDRSRHFWRGMVDGDGCVRIGRVKGFGFGAPDVALIGASKKLLEQFRTFVGSHIGKYGSLKERRVSTSSRNAPCYTACYGWNAAIRIADLLYSGCSVALQRKREAAAKILQLASEGRLGGARRLTVVPLGKVA